MSDKIRRNGQLSSCEPCRKSKLRCDHNRPICGRCVRRRLTPEQCHYHPAPMAKQMTTPSDTPAGGTYRLQDVSESVASWPSPAPEDSPSYALLNVNRNLMRFADPSTLQSKRTYASLTRTGVAPPYPYFPDHHMISEGANLLSRIFNLVEEIGQPLEEFSTDRAEAEPWPSGPLGKVAYIATKHSLRELSTDRSARALQSTSRAIFEHTSRPPVFPPTAADGALEAAFSASTLRWELVGLYCAQVGIYLGLEIDKSVNAAAHKKWKLDRKTLMQEFFRACIQCESFCDRLGAVNDFTLWFLMVSILFATWCFGDDSYHVFRMLGSMTSVFLALGFQKGAQDDSLAPIYLVELRKRAIAWAHDHDKVCGSFTSRPIRLSRHFCVTELPLDLPDAVITGPVKALQEARANLDENGWNKDKAVLQASRYRILLLLCPLREEALELKLGPAIPDLAAKARLAMQKLSSTWQAIPSHMRYEVAQPSTIQTDSSMILLYLRLEYLYTEFLLRTLLVNAGNGGREELMATAHEILGLVLLPTRKRNLLYSHRADMEWALVFHAMPCASVLVLELLREAQHPEEQHIINRSGIIQDISVLISCCESLTESGQNNFQICQQAQSIFSKSLDSILNNQAEALTRVTMDEELLVIPNESAGSMNAEVAVQDPIPEWTSWLESVGLQADPWLDLFVPTLEFPVDTTV